MDRWSASREIMEGVGRVSDALAAIKRRQTPSSTGQSLHHAERQVISLLAEHPQSNVTALAWRLRVTKGAISQTIDRLVNKGAAWRVKSRGNAKEVLVELTTTGQRAYDEIHQAQEEAVSRLLDELKKHPDEHVEFLLYMLGWFSENLDKDNTT